MITNINRAGYEVKGFYFKDYTNLSLDEKRMVLDWRNSESVRKWMYNQEIISLEDHLRFIETLSEREDRYYWLVYSANGEPIGSCYMVDIDRKKDQAEFGLYMRPDSRVFGFDFVRTCFYFYFVALDFNNIYCAVDARNRDAMSIDMFLGCDFKDEKQENGIKYLISTNLHKELFVQKYNLKFKDYLLYCKSLK